MAVRSVRFRCSVIADQRSSKHSIRLTISPTVSGLSAAHTIYLAGGNVVVLDKQGKPLRFALPFHM